MKIAIISDSHDNLATIEIFTDWIKVNPVDLVIHCGDICSAEAVRQLADNLDCHIHFVYGNADFKEQIESQCKKIKNITLHGEIGRLEVGGQKIAFCHFPCLIEELVAEKRYQIIFHGHTHKPWEEKNGDCLILNPGTLAGIHYPASFAVYDTETGKRELKVLSTLKV
jgi:putative phosphoesterase